MHKNSRGHLPFRTWHNQEVLLIIYRPKQNLKRETESYGVQEDYKVFVMSYTSLAYTDLILYWEKLLPLSDFERWSFSR